VSEADAVSTAPGISPNGEMSLESGHTEVRRQSRRLAPTWISRHRGAAAKPVSCHLQSGAGRLVRSHLPFGATMYPKFNLVKICPKFMDFNFGVIVTKKIMNFG
jgi:hypothetical protein